MAVFAFVLIAPIFYTVHLSLNRERLIGGNQFVGFDNYVRAASDPKLWEAAGHILLYFVIQVPLMIFLALLLALALDSKRLLGGPLFRIVIFLPYAVPGVVAALIWGFMYSGRFGLVANLSDFFGVELPNLLSSNIVLVSLANIATWEYVGYCMLVFYAALRSISPELYEAAAIDGASELRIIRSIKIPGIRGALVIVLIFSIIGSFQLFNEPNILQNMAPTIISSHFTPNMYAYYLSFSGQQYNYAAAIAIVVGLITATIAYFVQNAGQRRGDFG